MSTELSQSRSTALELRKNNRELEKQLGMSKVKQKKVCRVIGEYHSLSQP